MSYAWLDDAPLPFGAIRGAVFTYLNDALIALLAMPREALLGKPLFTPIAPEDRERVRDRHLARLRTEPVPDSYEFDVIRGDGERRHVEIFVSRSGEDTLFQLRDLTEVARRQEKLREVARLGASVQAERSPEAIFAAVTRGLAAVDVSLMRMTPEGDGLRVTALHMPGELLPRVEAALGRSFVGFHGPWRPGLEVAWREGAVYIDDMLSSINNFVGEDAGLSIRRLAQQASLERGAALRVDVDGRPGELLVLLSAWMRPEDLPALSLFGAQISAALGAARAIADGARRNAELSAMNRLATEAGVAEDLGRLFRAGCHEIGAVLGYDAVAIYLVSEDGKHAHLAHQHGGVPEVGRKIQHVPIEGTKLGEVARSGQSRVLRLADYPEDRRELLRRAGQVVVISVPLVVRSRVVGVMNAALTSEREVPAHEVEVLQAMGAHFAAAVEASRLVEDLRRSYAELRHTQEQLVERERLAALGELAAVVAHEVRNPLGVIFNSLASVRRLVDVEGAAGSLLRMMDEEAHRLNQIVGDLLDFARPTVPALHLERMEAVVEEAVGAALAGGATRVEVERHFEAGLPAVPLDARLMRQAVLNLALNAIQAMPSGGKLRLRLGREASGGRSMAVLEVADTGPGIGQDVRARMFEPFFTTKATGTGLGLAVVRRIVQSHQGDLVVTSEEGKGTVVRMRLPLEPEAGPGVSPPG